MKTLLLLLLGALISLPISVMATAPAYGPGGADPNGLFSLYFQNFVDPSNQCTGMNFARWAKNTLWADYMKPNCVSIQGPVALVLKQTSPSSGDSFINGFDSTTWAPVYTHINPVIATYLSTFSPSGSSDQFVNGFNGAGQPNYTSVNTAIGNYLTTNLSSYISSNFSANNNTINVGSSTIVTSQWQNNGADEIYYMNRVWIGTNNPIDDHSLEVNGSAVVKGQFFTKKELIFGDHLTRPEIYADGGATFGGQGLIFSANSFRFIPRDSTFSSIDVWSWKITTLSTANTDTPNTLATKDYVDGKLTGGTTDTKGYSDNKSCGPTGWFTNNARTCLPGYTLTACSASNPTFFGGGVHISGNTCSAQIACNSSSRTELFITCVKF